MVAQRVIEIVAAKAHGAPAPPTPESTLEELGLDSLDAVEIMYELEESLKVSIPNERVKEMRTVGDIVAGVEALVAARDAAAPGAAG
ncbi:MAG: acyl carrier protein [Gemmatimonadaceae bacterium]|jgi:acyl carrier protein